MTFVIMKMILHAFHRDVQENNSRLFMLHQYNVQVCKLSSKPNNLDNLHSTISTCIPSFPSTLEIVQQGQRNLRMWTVHTKSQLLCSLLRQPPQAHFCSAASVVQHHLRKITSKLLGDDMYKILIVRKIEAGWKNWCTNFRTIDTST